MKNRKVFYAMLLTATLAVVLSSFLATGFAIARQTEGAGELKFAVDRRGEMRLLFPDQNGKYDLRKDEFTIQLPSFELASKLESKFTGLKEAVDKLTGTVKSLKGKDEDLEKRIVALETNQKNSASSSISNATTTLKTNTGNASPTPPAPAPTPTPAPAPAPALVQTTPAQATVVFLEMNEGQGTSLKDSSGLGNDAIIAGAVWEQTPGGKWSLSFDGVDDFVDDGNGNSTNFTGGDFTIATWVKVTSVATNPAIFSRGVHLVDGYFAYIDTSRAIHFLTEQAGAVQDSYTADNTVTPNAWAFMAFTRSGASVTTYLDALDVSRNRASHIDPLPNSRKFHIGIMDDEKGQPFKGSIAMTRVFNRALTAAEIQELFTQQKALFGLP